MESNQQAFWQFSDQLRLHTSNLANLSLNDSIWSSGYASKRPDDRKNFDARVGGDAVNSLAGPGPGPKLPQLNESWKIGSGSGPVVSGNDFNPVAADGWSKIGNANGGGAGGDFNGFNYGWKMGNPTGGNDFNAFNYGWKANSGKDFNGFDDGWKMGGYNLGVNEGFNTGMYAKSVNFLNNNVNLKGGKNRNEDFHGGKTAKKNGNGNKKINGGDGYNNGEEKEARSGVDKRFKTLPPSESLPKHETVGGYIFVCNNDTMQENLKRQLFGLPPRYRDSVRQITPGLPIFLYNYSTHQLHGIFEAASFGGSNLDPTAWEDKKCPGESRFPAQVRVMTRKICEPLEEDSFRPILHHYDGPKFRLELNVPEALSLLDIFAEQDSNLTGLISFDDTE
ncbi:DCD domain-containing protein NRP-B-like [Rhodamnia argentea]|uniref:DCD domain-containing protein NRP-B-like n=1 Tax=Rhodamnia argentea TaxID=178133 RepID=A0ABM3HX90_9MYRT|nr:DCD domain-containing protein NRP-B-like [Rhodamnia argentea]